MNVNKFKVFVDFDGTITKVDVGEAIFRAFGNAVETNIIVADLLSGKITARMCWELLFATIKNINLAKLNNFIDQMNIDPTFNQFHKYCLENEIELFVLSDGFDYYIKRIFKKAKLNNLNIFANSLIINDKNEMIPAFPYFDIDCQTSANCKRNHILNNSGDEEFTVYIGDGNSDKYSTQFCDFIFAKDDLLKFCEKERITFFPFNNFEDVITRLDLLKSKKRLKKRYQAELKRKEIYLQE
ncbi:MAG: 2-hydroxy-3-keto-5-methylthiopentenyl-1-phosphate phosphatase [Ignavibacteria bacterium RIFOXYB2_FULL_35_12]|nr:MAG: 2-hydroxy-3-keto-5-methylthiopentenyl-1-phosphate phosphatase [Ignavibacteria bacterium GWF2_35_20]OGU77379.1 MAG: 2-hydroxy-3-keto-5-methylthiopentenyl-1-phosphate phosphatase [Ignavibacteria bacterium RBG_16_35_7]OGU80792.1 MAG: 2-hydroxy-3-keto-5-methylthiopentenyl-1-phosphate phosphatase [Ignavibacteria bacterium RIFOXYA2_FULL_35_9]OGU86115.1 MAG: 2-hydroxy-3-keto-5-methylthiopentenyl-1-phosphate phosphatase [Ignavibacteria bacterium RIFOXYA12_FULL_35_25]OGU92800.1 MAG: 2-hydroxy-3-